MALYLGPHTNSPQSPSPRWNQSIWLSPMHPEKLSLGLYFSTNYISSPAHLSSSPIIRPLSRLFNILFIINEPNTSTFATILSAMHIKRIKLSSIMFQRQNNSQTSSPRRWDLNFTNDAYKR